MRVKICGITRPEDARAAEAAGADAVGFILAPGYGRSVGLEQAARISAAVGSATARVGVFVDAPFEDVLGAARALKLTAVQLHGSEEPAYAAALREEVRVVKVFSFREGLTREALGAFPADAVMLDSPKGGGGAPFDWARAAPLRGVANLVLAGGLTSHNVAAGVAALRALGGGRRFGGGVKLGRQGRAEDKGFRTCCALRFVIHSYPQLSTSLWISPEVRTVT